MGSPVGLFRENLCFGPFRTVIGEAAVVQRAKAINDVYGVPGAVPQHPHTVTAFLCVQPAVPPAYLICIKQFHSYKYSNFTE